MQVFDYPLLCWSLDEFYFIYILKFILHMDHCTHPAGPVISGSEEALPERTWAGERNKTKQNSLVKASLY